MTLVAERAAPTSTRSSPSKASFPGGIDGSEHTQSSARNQAAKPPVEELLRGSFETPEWAEDPLEPSGEESGDPVDDAPRPRGEEPPVAPLPDPDCIEVTISGRGWGRAGPFILNERTFHRLCAGARKLERLVEEVSRD